MRPLFFKLTLWNDPQKGAKRPAEWGACNGANRYASWRRGKAKGAKGSVVEITKQNSSFL